MRSKYGPETKRKIGIADMDISSPFRIVDGPGQAVGAVISCRLLTAFPSSYPRAVVDNLARKFKQVLREVSSLAQPQVREVQAQLSGFLEEMASSSGCEDGLVWMELRSQASARRSPPISLSMSADRVEAWLAEIYTNLALDSAETCSVTCGQTMSEFCASSSSGNALPDMVHIWHELPYSMLSESQLEALCLWMTLQTFTVLIALFSPRKTEGRERGSLAILQRRTLTVLCDGEVEWCSRS
jgi:hypothetical protein